MRDSPLGLLIFFSMISPALLPFFADGEDPPLLDVSFYAGLFFTAFYLVVSIV